MPRFLPNFASIWLLLFVSTIRSEPAWAALEAADQADFTSSGGITFELPRSEVSSSAKQLNKQWERLSEGNSCFQQVSDPAAEPKLPESRPGVDARLGPSGQRNYD